MSNIAVYEKGTTNFFNQGKGILSDVISSDTTQTVSSSGNVQSRLELSYPVGGYLSEQLTEGNFLRVSMDINSSKYAVFEINDSIKDDSGTLTIYGAPYSDRIGRMSFDNGGKFGSYSSVQTALNYAKSQMKDFPSWFQLTSNVNKSVDFTKDGIVKDFATFLDLLNQKVSGNVYYGLNIIQIYSALGKDRTDITLRDDRNANSVKVKTDYSSIINRIIPVLPIRDKDGNATQETKVGTIVNSSTPNQFIDYWAGLAVQLDTQDLANTYFNRTHADRPVQTVDVDPIGMDEDFSDIDIFDRVQLYSTKLKYTDKLRVSKRVIDNLTGMVTSFSLGSSSVTLTNQIQQVQNDVANQIQAITSVVISASGKNQTYISNIKPTSANEGDMWIQEDGDYQAFWVYKNGDWVRLIDSNTQKAITDGVTKAIGQSKLDTKELVESNNAIIRSEMQTVATQKAKDEIAKGSFNANAQAYANSAQSAAIAQAQSLISSASTDWSKQLEDANSDYTKKYSEVKTVADGVTESFNSYKLTNSYKLVSYKSLIDKNSQAITLAATKTELNTAKYEFTSQVASVKEDYKSITQSVTQIQGQYNDLMQVNLVNNSDFSPDLGGWTTRGAGNFTTGDYDHYGGVYVVESTDWSLARTNSAPIPLNSTSSQAYSLSFNAYIFSLPSEGRVVSHLTFLDAKLNETSNQYPGYTELGPKGTGKWFNIKLNNIGFTPPAGAKYVVFSFDARGKGTKAGFDKPILVSGDTVGSYVRGQYSNNDKIALQQITIDSISDVVSNPTTGLSRRIQTAEGFLTEVRGTDIPALQKATFWQPYSSLNFNDYTKQGSFFFNTTSAKTNGPTTSNSWTYLMVEQGTSANDRIKQTAWYDGTNGVKITYVRTLNSGIWSPWYANDNDSVATISVMNGHIEQEISDRKTGDSNTLSQSKDYTTSQIKSAVSGVNSTISQTASAILANISATNLFPNTEFNQDYGWRSKSGTISYLSNQNIDGQYHGIVRVTTISDSAQGYWGKNIPVQGGAKYSGSVRVHFNNNGATNGVAAYDLWFADKNGARISTGVGNQNNSLTKMVSSPYWVDLWIDGTTAPINAVYAQVSLLAAGGSGMTADFTMPTFTATDVHQPYSPNDDITTQLSLLKDNWSIGISDNIGNITSGIVGNPWYLAIVSSKVVINSPETQINGRAWIKTAMIADGQIGTAQIGDASITSAKILSLDVDKLSGNISNFIQSNWNGVYGSTSINSAGVTIAAGNTTTTFDTTGAHYLNSSGMRATYSFGRWSDSNSNPTSAIGLYLGATGSSNGFINILGTGGSAALVLAGSTMDYGSNLNVMQGTLNSYVHVNIREQLHFKGNRYNSPSYIEINESNRTFNFFTGGGSASGGNYFYFNQKVISSGTFSSTSTLSKKNIISDYVENALEEIIKTNLVRFEYKNRPGEQQVSPIIDDINADKKYYIPSTIVGESGQYVDMYSMISMAWKAIQQLNEKIGEK